MYLDKAHEERNERILKAIESYTNKNTQSKELAHKALVRAGILRRSGGHTVSFGGSSSSLINGFFLNLMNASKTKIEIYNTALFVDEWLDESQNKEDALKALIFAFELSEIDIELAIEYALKAKASVLKAAEDFKV